MDGQLLLIPSERYSIDTCVFIDIWSSPDNMFSRERMPALWAHIEKLVDEGKIFATKEVYVELKRHASPDLMVWLKAHKEMFIQDRAQIETAGRIVNGIYARYRDGYRPDIKNGADPFVVAAAMNHSAVVFTQELRLPKGHDPNFVPQPKIPDVCDEYGLECVTIEQFIGREGFTIGLVDGSGKAVKVAQQPTVIAKAA